MQHETKKQYVIAVLIFSLNISLAIAAPDLNTTRNNLAIPIKTEMTLTSVVDTLDSIANRNQVKRNRLNTDGRSSSMEIDKNDNTRISIETKPKALALIVGGLGLLFFVACRRKSTGYSTF